MLLASVIWCAALLACWAAAAAAAGQLLGSTDGLSVQELLDGVINVVYAGGQERILISLPATSSRCRWILLV
jgi:hypothetical protein